MARCGHFTTNLPCASALPEFRCLNSALPWCPICAAAGWVVHYWMLCVQCAGTQTALCLNVHVRNPARKLYQRKGFEEIGQGRGPLGIAMQKDL